MSINPQSIQMFELYQFSVENASIESISKFTESQREFIRKDLRHDSKIEIKVQCMEDIMFGLTLPAKKKCFDFLAFNSG